MRTETVTIVSKKESGMLLEVSYSKRYKVYEVLTAVVYRDDAAYRGFANFALSAVCRNEKFALKKFNSI